MEYERLSEIAALGGEERIVPVLSETARYVRKTMVDAIYHANLDLPRRGHYGSSSSSVEIYLTELVRLANPYNDFIAWKPHASPVVYVLLYLLGELTLADLKSLRRKDSPCQAYLNHWMTPAVSLSTGCMGYPLPFCCGRALGDKIDGIGRRVFVNLGDAEFTMPMGMEAIRLAGVQRLNNYGVVVDDNRKSMSGLTSHLMGDRPIEDYFRFLGWNVIVAGGHDVKELWEAFGDFEREMQTSGNPTALVARTDKWRDLPDPDGVGNHAHMQNLDASAYRRFYRENGWEGQEPFCPPSPHIRDFFGILAEIFKTNAAARRKTSAARLRPVASMMGRQVDAGGAKSPLQAVQEVFRRRVATREGRKDLLYVDPDLGKFPGLLPRCSGADSVEGEMVSPKNPGGFVVRAGLSDPFAVAVASGLGRDSSRYPVIPLLDGFSLLVSESIKQGSLEGSRFLTLGIETASWEGLTHQPGTSGNTVFRNLPYRPKNLWPKDRRAGAAPDADWEFGVYSYLPCHPREAAVLFEECVRERRMAYMRITAFEPPAEALKWFDGISNEEFQRGGYVIGPRYERPDLVILTCGREVYTCIEAAERLREEHPCALIQLSAVNLLNLITSRRTGDRRLMEELIPGEAALLRVAGLPLDALGVACGPNQESLGTEYLTQSCTQDELEADQGYGVDAIVDTGRRLLSRITARHGLRTAPVFTASTDAVRKAS